MLGVLWGMLEREMYIVVPNYSKAWQKVLLFESSPKTNNNKYWLSRTKTYHEAYEHTYFLCFGDTCSVNKHQISTLISWSIDIPRDLVDEYLNSPPSAPFNPGKSVNIL